ncbi:MAG: DUF1217 domain-containing protein [Rhodobacteraceae bacterium]|nr:DUF1217 domain-containing protein [Paracoccaceae bacterium]
MSFQPILPMGGLAGWAFLKRTQDSQETAFKASPQLNRDTDYFQDNIGNISSAEDLVSDHRLLKVALGAFGLSADIDSQFFVRKVLEEGTLAEDSLANRMTDSRYKELSAAFGFGDFDTPRTKISDFGDKIVEAYQTRSFEVSIGQQDDSMRLALNAERELAKIAQKDLSDDAKWYLVMGDGPLREVFETALGLPTGFGQLDIDQQLEVFRDKTSSFMGNGEVDQFTDPENVASLIERYLLMSQISNSASTSSAQIALTLLQGG